MSEFFSFAREMITTFLQGFWTIILGIFNGIVGIFNFPKYVQIYQDYSSDFDFGAWVLSFLLVLLMVALIAGLIYLFVFLIRRAIRRRKTFVSQDQLLAEVAELNNEVMKARIDRDKILSLKLSQLGPHGELPEEITGEKTTEVTEGESRFMKLTKVDKEMDNYEEPLYDDDLTLEEICNRFRNFNCSRLRLFYDPKIIRLFISSFGCTRLLILQGISGTGKTSLPYSFGKFIQNDVEIAAVQPSWRDRTELFGYFNEFTKRFNETEILKKLYEATYTDNVYVTILDEMNIARVEYYFAEMLSILEMPSKDEWVIDLVPSGWDNDPKHIVEGRFKLPENTWYVGTANNDDSTFSISDKVYDRAIPINIDTKGVPFEAPYTQNIKLSYSHLSNLFDKAKTDHPVSQANLDKIELLDNYVIEHFRLAFGNRILKQLKEFVPCFVGCGGTELEGIDYILCVKIFRKFESLNLSFIRDELDGLLGYLDELFGLRNMQETEAYIKRLQKLF
ncbi:MAG: hypothetical protein K6G38_02895 [Gammaproteobacteria bacterium]|nr:hypothetical protein [Gammaproteobacteria bacterium]